MNTSLKKLLLVVFTLFLGVTSSGAKADTDYDFNFSGNNISVVGVFGVDGGIIKSIRGTVSGHMRINQEITELINPGLYIDNNNLYFPSAPYLDGSGVSFRTSLYEYKLFYADSDYSLFTVNVGDFGSMTSSISAPEMSASLIPQVGLLLGCLFFLMGRKNEVVESMMTA